ncbi:MAG: hypothetical protein AB1352_01265 [Patescibacteria group bacterium]
MPEQTQPQPQLPPNQKRSLPFPLMVLLICVAVVMVAYAYQRYFVAQEPPTPPLPVEEPATAEDTGTCKNLCGNGTCEEIVCMAIGCPCPETSSTCPQDCK